MSEAQVNLIKRVKRAVRPYVPHFVMNWKDERFWSRVGEIELHLVEELCRPGEDAIDVGAHDGCYIHFMKKVATKVYAFEPLADMAADLVSKFPEDNVIVSTVALSNVSGHANLRIPELNGALVPGCSSLSTDTAALYPQTRDMSVRTEPLDKVYQGQAGFMKIDVEGFEESVLEGAEMTIRRSHPRILMELDEYFSQGIVRRTRDWMQVRGYRGYFLHRRELTPLVCFNRSTMQRMEDRPDLEGVFEDRPRFATYINNFIFIHESEIGPVIRRLRNKIERL